MVLPLKPAALTPVGGCARVSRRSLTQSCMHPYLTVRECAALICFIKITFPLVGASIRCPHRTDFLKKADEFLDSAVFITHVHDTSRRNCQHHQPNYRISHSYAITTPVKAWF